MDGGADMMLLLSMKRFDLALSYHEDEVSMRRGPVSWWMKCDLK
jgi:hypothetical protein